MIQFNIIDADSGLGIVTFYRNGVNEIQRSLNIKKILSNIKYKQALVGIKESNVDFKKTGENEYWLNSTSVVKPLIYKNKMLELYNNLINLPVDKMDILFSPPIASQFLNYTCNHQLLQHEYMKNENYEIKQSSMHHRRKSLQLFPSREEVIMNYNSLRSSILNCRIASSTSRYCIYMNIIVIYIYVYIAIMYLI